MKNLNLEDILKFIEGKTGLNLIKYGESYLETRILQFCEEEQFSNQEELLTFFQKNEGSISNFINFILISSTSFFREPKSFSLFKEKVVAYLKNHRHGDELRVWVPGCSTGEEAYSVAIILKESLEELGFDSKQVKVFATDINENNISIAETGLFHKKFTESISKERLRRFFKEEGEQFQPISMIKKMVSFVSHDLLKHAPFFNLDIIVCRNVLIYFSAKEQNEVLSSFYESLKHKGILFSGENELSLILQDKWWKQFEQKIAIFEKKTFGEESDEILGTETYKKLYSRNISFSVDLKREDRLSLTNPYVDLLLQGMLNDGIFLKKNFDILYVVGGAEKYFSLKKGYFSGQVFDFLKDEIKRECRIALEECTQQECVSAYEISSENLTIKAHFLKLTNDLEGFYLQFDSLLEKDKKQKKVSEINEDELSLLKKSLDKKEEEIFYLKEQNDDLNSLTRSLSNDLEKEKAYSKSSMSFFESVNKENTLLKENSNLLKSLEDNEQEAFLYLTGDGILKKFNKKATDFFPLVDSDNGSSLDRVVSQFKSFSANDCLADIKKNKKFKSTKLISKKGEEALLQIILVSPNLYLFKITELP